MIKGNPLSEVVWLIWILFGIAWELFAFTPLGRRWGVEPLTNIVRDRVFASRYGEAAVAVFIGFMGWLLWHWLVKRGPHGEQAGTPDRDDADDNPDKP